MKTELIYLWIEKDEHGCFQKRGFNFSPCYHVDFDDDLDELTIGKTGKINVFSNGEIQNVTAIVGENGVGKSTMIQYLTGLSDAPFHETQQKGYEEWTRKINSERSFVAVFKQSEAEEEFKIINFRACKRPIWYKGNMVNRLFLTFRIKRIRQIGFRRGSERLRCIRWS